MSDQGIFWPLILGVTSSTLHLGHMQIAYSMAWARCNLVPKNRSVLELFRRLAREIEPVSMLPFPLQLKRL